MEALVNGFTLNIADGCFPLSSDSMVLADFVKLQRNAAVLDLGAGCGTLGVLLCAGDPSCHVTGIEIDPVAAEASRKNIADNRLESRLHILCRDLRGISDFLPAGSFSCCLSNPPYFSGGPASNQLPAARREDFCTPEDLFRAAGWALKYGGDFYLVQKPERLGQLIGEGFRQGFACKQLRLIRHRENGPVTLVLLKLRKGGKPGMLLDELSFYTSEGRPTEDYKRIYHIEEA